MGINDIAAQTLTVLRRAESLFGAPDDTSAAAAAADQLRRAAGVIDALGERHSELSGAGVSGHRQLIDRSAEEAAASADADAWLGAQLSAAAARHRYGRVRAQNLCADAATARERCAALSGTAAGDLASLTALCAQVAGMQQLLAEHAGQDSAAAAQLREVGYRG